MKHLSVPESNATQAVQCITLTEVLNAILWAHDRNRIWTAKTADAGWIVHIEMTPRDGDVTEEEITGRAASREVD